MRYTPRTTRRLLFVLLGTPSGVIPSSRRPKHSALARRIIYACVGRQGLVVGQYIIHTTLYTRGRDRLLLSLLPQWEKCRGKKTGARQYWSDRPFVWYGLRNCVCLANNCSLQACFRKSCASWTRWRSSFFTPTGYTVRHRRFAVILVEDPIEWCHFSEEHSCSLVDRGPIFLVLLVQIEKCQPRNTKTGYYYINSSII